MKGLLIGFSIIIAIVISSAILSGFVEVHNYVNGDTTFSMSDSYVIKTGYGGILFVSSPTNTIILVNLQGVHFA